MKLFSERRESTITLEELARKCAMKYGASIESCEKYARMLRNTLIECMIDGLSVKISSLGTFVVHKRPAREGINNVNGANKKRIHIAERYRVRFVPSGGLNEKIDKNLKLRQ